MSKVYEVTLMSADEKYAPPSENVLNVTVIGDVVCLTICEIQEEYHTTTVKTLEYIVVNKRDLVYALCQDESE